MATLQYRMVMSGNTTAIPAATSRVTGLGHACDLRIDTPTLNDRQIIHRTAATITQLEVVIGTNASTGAGSAITQKGGVNQNLTVTIGAGVTGSIEDLTHSDTIASTDKWCIQFTSGSGGTMTPNTAAVTCTCNDGTLTCRMATGFDLFHAATSLQHVAGGIANDVSGTDTSAQVRANVNATWKNWSMRIGANSASATCTYRNRINAGNGTMVLTVTAAATGDFEDTTHSDAIVTTDLVNFNMTTAGAGNIVPNYMASDWVITNNRVPHINSFDGGVSIASGVSNQGFAIGGELTSMGTTLSFVTFKFPRTCENLGCNLTANTLNGNLTYTFFVNGSSTSVVVTVSGGTTGQVNNLSNTAAVAANDQLHVRPNTTAANSGSATQKNIRLDMIIPLTVSRRPDAVSMRGGRLGITAHRSAPMIRVG